ncbi:MULTISPECIES: protein translocase subunit SecF [unclassified Paenibacillus]|uniref:protein translocase subunit SecF n=1 Tax=unclassified Paenibacillus TaxID=185978 RepID=UPI001AEAE53C|nr:MULTISPECIES: protein translocase subunit SecF [unclassified Paenibacillus]MBP1156547.1 SecD/SecF fusion protein [Paenibacillus sp. PvP091]MBP1172715.1 SecD/SecF fusion protein [Paenibacillus sp. PvR098]MBP2439095.1 SecD/SecF fusion protein [Paenibacillus sp. PvP052]
MLYNANYDLMKHRRKFFGFSIAITVIGIITMLIFGLNLGVDFKAGTTLDISTGGKAIQQSQAAELVKSAGLDTATPPIIGGAAEDRVTLRFDKVLTSQEVGQIEASFKTAFGDNISKEENTVDTDLAKELAMKAVLAVLLASLGIVIYVSIRFEWRFAIGAIAALLHDAFMVIAIFSIFRLEVNLPFVAAVLTIIGYSINDTIVIFDRIRENMRFAKVKTFEDLSQIVNRSIWQTMTRSINTVLTVLIAAVLLFVMGSEAIKLFSLAMIIGLVSGMYSSVIIASPIWLVLKHKSLNSKKKAAA